MQGRSSARDQIGVESVTTKSGPRRVNVRPPALGIEVQVQSNLTDTRYFAKSAWLMGPDSEGEPSYLQLYRLPKDAERAARDINRTGRAKSPDHYARLRRLDR